jgi:hypothetical protein
MNVPELKTNQLITITYFIGILIVLFVVYKILAGVGLVKTAAKKKELANEATAITEVQTADYWNPDLWKSAAQSGKLLPAQTVIDYANSLRDAMAGLGTDEQAIYTVFGKLKYKVQISEIAGAYKAAYGFPWYIKTDNLQNDLLNELSDAELAHLQELINKLKN